MSDETKSNKGGAREGSGRKRLDSERRDYPMRLTATEKEIIDSYRASKGLDK